jgi:hypothetical protein
MDESVSVLRAEFLRNPLAQLTIVMFAIVRKAILHWRAMIMKNIRIRALVWAMAFGSTLVSTNLLGQPPASVPVGPPDQSNRPVGPPISIDQAPFQAPHGIPPFVAPPTPKNGGVHVRQSYDGIDFLISDCLCYPPDTNIAVGNNYVVETVNKEMRIFDKRTGTILLEEPLRLVFGNTFRGDPYVVYDDNANRWYITALDNADVSGGGGLYLAISYDGNPLLGFQTIHIPNNHVGGGDRSDYPKIGFNKDAIFISYRNLGFGNGTLVIDTIDKAAALSGTLTFFETSRQAFDAIPPAQVHDDGTGGVEWFVSVDDREGDTIRVTRMTNYFNVNPTFEETPLTVTPYKYAPAALQPGGTITTFPNTTTTQVQYHDGHLVTAMASSVAADGFTFPKGLYYEVIVDETGGTKPALLREGVIDPGAGVAVQMPSVDEDQHGNLGFTWMESSETEYLSMWAGTLTKNGRFASEAVAPGQGFFYVSDRIGDYSTVVLDPNDKTFWSANEYIGPDGASDVWRTHITSFTAK